MRYASIAVGLIAMSGFLILSGPAAAQGFGQVAFGVAPPAAEAPAANPAGHDVTGVTVKGKKQAEVDKDPNQVLCHSEPVIGSLLPKKVCASRRELAERRQNDQEVARRFSDERVDGAMPH